MPSQTAAPWAIPYPVGTDRVMDGDNAIQGVADRMHALFNQNIKGVPVPQTTAPAQNGWVGGHSVYFVRNGVVQVIFSLAKAAWSANDLVFTMPAPYIPYLVVVASCYGLNTVQPIAAQIGTNGEFRILVASSSHGGAVGSLVYHYGNTN